MEATNFEFTDIQLAKIGASMALEMYRLEHADFISADEAARLLGCCKSTLYNKALPHNQYGWKKQAILDELNK